MYARSLQSARRQNVDHFALEKPEGVTAPRGPAAKLSCAKASRHCSVHECLPQMRRVRRPMATISDCSGIWAGSRHRCRPDMSPFRQISWQRLFLSAYEDMPQVCYYLIRFPGPDSPPRIGALPHRDRSRWAAIFLASREAAHPRVADLRPAERADHNSTTPMVIGEWPPQCFGSARVRSWPEPPVRRSAAVRQLSRRTRRSAGATNTDVPRFTSPARVLLRCNDRSCHFANVLEEKPNQRAQHPVLQRQNRNRISMNLQIDRQDSDRKLSGIEAQQRTRQRCHERSSG
jgi:hypothetical protein